MAELEEDEEKEVEEDEENKNFYEGIKERKWIEERENIRRTYRWTVKYKNRTLKTQK